MRNFFIATVVVASLAAAHSVYAADDAKPLKDIQWAFEGTMGAFDEASVQRGFQVYREVCSACHGLKRIAFRNLQSVGFSEAEVKTLAAQYDITDGPNDEGDMFTRPGRPSDRILGPYVNEQQARSLNNGAYPPDMSLLVKARPHGADYIYSLLTGYGEPKPDSVELLDGQYYNPYFPGGKLAMAAPLMDGQVTYADGTEATVDQMSRDVVNFLQWTAEPEMEHRKSMGLKVMIFLAIMTFIFYLAKRKVWKDIH
jgi:ubiquinol-cytochrome c reductase cytochrome c1 subunit